MKKTLLIISIIFSISSFSQELNIIYSEEKILLDGDLSEPIWTSIDVAKDFKRNFPIDSGYAQSKTEVKVFYSDAGIFVGVICFDKNPQKSIIQSLKRDFLLSNTDAFTITLDPFADLTNGFSFSLSPYNVQREGLVSGGGSSGSEATWDNKWFSETKILNDRWTAEMFIPFKTLRYSNKLSSWKVNFSRTDYKINEKSSWVGIPINFGLETLTFSGNLVFNEPPPETGANVSFIPYLTSGLSGDYVNGNNESIIGNIGADAKVGVTQSLNLDVTINPDFSNVEVDDQILNLNRFSIALPEKRQFFIENSDLFSQFGFRRIRPFFSRSIGLKDTSGNGEMIQVPILSGLRLSGKINKYWRLGALNVIEMDSSAYMLSSNNQLTQNDFISNTYDYKSYNVGVLQRQLGSNSNISGIFVNQTPFSNNENINSVAGVDLNYASNNGIYKGKIFSHQSFTEGVNKKAWSQQANASFFIRSTKKLFLMWNHEYVGENYNAANGFVARKGIWRLEPMIGHTIFPKINFIQSVRHELYSNYYTDLNYKRLDDLRRVSSNVKFINTSEFYFEAVRNYTRLRYDFDPTFQGDTSYLAESKFINYNFGIGYWSSITNMFRYKLNMDYGQYFTGTKLGTRVELFYRLQPKAIFSILVNNNNIKLPGFKNVNLTRIGPKVEVTLTNNLFVNYYLQYNSISSNFSNNFRVQWRFKPLSDFFFVYTDNYGATSEVVNNQYQFNINEKKNRGIVFKFVYWLNL